MSLDPHPGDSASGLTEPEAREFHRIFITSFIVFLIIALVAHYLAWQWRPWGGHYSSLIDGASKVAGFISSSFA
jgi:light-harvesting complex 1 beta chain